MACDSVSQLRGLFDFPNACKRFLGNVLVQLHVAFEPLHQRARQRRRRLVRGLHLIQRFNLGFEIGLVRHKLRDLRAGAAFHQNFDSAIGQFEQLQNIREGTDAIDVAFARFVLRRIAL